MKIAQKSDIGTVRQENQDRVAAKILGESSAFAVVCDGMGGENAGSLASELAITELCGRICGGFSSEMKPSSVKNLLMSSIEAANSAVYSRAKENPNYQGMGTTCVAVIASGTAAYMINIGDSRAYIIRNGEIEQITEDHTLVNLWVSQGKITPEEARIHPQKNLITRAVGIQPRVRADYYEFDTELGDRILLCSDGLTAYCDEDRLLEVISENEPQSAVDELVAFARESGGSDNISATIISISDESEETEDGQ